MSFYKKTVRDINLRDKRVLLRADYNVPLDNGQISDDYRIRQSAQTIKYILEAGANSLVIISHLGRPSGRTDKQFSLEPVAKHLGRLLDRPVSFWPDCIGPDAQQAAAKLKDGQILLLENLRYYAGEEKNDKAFARSLVEASAADIFVQDGFGVVHREHASTDAITDFLPSVAGLLLEKEITTIEEVLNNPTRPLTAIVGGAKISDKIDVLSRFIELADCVAIGGALANNFLHAEGFKVGQSRVEPESYGLADDILAKAKAAEKTRPFRFLVPVDVVVSRSLDGRGPTRIVDMASHILADIEAYPRRPAPASYTVAATEKILDIGPVSAGMMAGAIGISRTVIWCGPLGVTETPGLAGAHDPFGHGTRTVVEAIIGKSNSHASKPYSLVGGGDTVSYVEARGRIEDFSHVSTGGSASLELLAGHKLPGVEALQDK